MPPHVQSLVARRARILHLGNLVNYGYRLVKHLREADVDAHLLMNPDAPTLSHPKSQTRNIPDWVHFWKRGSHLRSFLEILREVRNYDLVHSYYTTVLPLQFTSTPYVFHAMGSDLRENVQWPIRGMLMRRALRKAELCVCSQADLLEWYDKVGVKVHVSYPPIDAGFYSPAKAPRNQRFEIFHPSQQDWAHKANDRFFRAFARYLREVDPDAHCTAIDSGADRERSKKLVRDLGLESHVDFIPIMNSEGIRERYHVSDVIADEYVVGSFGLITLESLSCGKTVVSYYDKGLTRRFYPDEPPVLWAFSEDDILLQLTRASDASFRKEQGKRARKWILKHHSPESVAKDLIALYQRLLPGKRIT